MVRVFRFSNNVKPKRKKYDSSISLDNYPLSETQSVASSSGDSTYSALTVPTVLSTVFPKLPDNHEDSYLVFNIEGDKEVEALTMVVYETSAPPSLPVSFDNWSK
jgi:hypothetical protein